MTNQKIDGRKWLLILLMISVISIQIIESSHDHLSLAAQQSCPVCKVIAHQPVDTAATVVVLLVLILPLQVIFRFRPKVARLAVSIFHPYLSRAPPRLFT